MKDKRIIRLKLSAERDHAISAGAFRVLCRIGSKLYVDPKTDVEAAFPLPWPVVALWDGCDDQKTAYRRTEELVKAGYLKCDGLRGCPPTNYYFLQFNSPKNGGIVTPKNGGNDSDKKGGHHISNSFQEEKIKDKREGINSSLRSTETKGVGKSSLRSAGTKGDSIAVPQPEQLTDAKRRLCVHELSRLRGNLGSKTGKGSF